MTNYKQVEEKVNLELEAKVNGIYNIYLKRLFDILLSLIAIALLTPVILIVSVGVFLDSGLPILYKAKRGGYRNIPFRILKFRSMVSNADKIGGGTTSLNDPRITRIGKVIRKTKLDELPQLFNVLKGDMSFIGPRPELLKYTEMYTGDERYILRVRPGITDFSSIHFISLDEVVGEFNADEMYEKHVLKAKNSMRIDYVRDISLMTDVKLLFLTAVLVLKKIFKIIFNK